LPAVVFSGRSSNCGRFSSQFAAAICCQDDLCISSEASFPSAKICFDFSPILSRLPADSSQNYAAAGVLFVQILTTKAGIKAITERTLPPLHWPSPNCGCRHLGVLLSAPGVLLKIISVGLRLGRFLSPSQMSSGGKDFIRPRFGQQLSLKAIILVFIIKAIDFGISSLVFNV
jgi:hypothetical protein